MNIPDLIDPTKDYYKMLGVPQDASQQDIKNRYKRLAMRYHPDRPRGNSEKFKTIQSAYDVIGDADKRKHYDTLRREYNSSPFWDFMTNRESRPGSKTKKKRTKKSDYFSRDENRILRDFIIDSLVIFQEQLKMRIPQYVQDDFKSAVEWVYKKWNELKKSNAFGGSRIYIKFGGFSVNREDIAKNDSLLE